jgi:hypothetical protein
VGRGQDALLLEFGHDQTPAAEADDAEIEVEDMDELLAAQARRFSTCARE